VVAARLAWQFVLAVAGSVLRGARVVKPGMVVQMATVGLKHRPGARADRRLGHASSLGVAGAGLATSLSVAAGVLLLSALPAPARRRRRAGRWVGPADKEILGRMLRVGLPAGGEFLIMVLLNSAIYALIATSAPPPRPASASAAA